MTVQQSAPLVGVVMGFSFDWEVMRHAVGMFAQFGIPSEAQVISVHRMSNDVFGHAEAVRGRGLRAIIAGAGGAVHLSGMIAAKTIVPMFGVSVPSKYLRGEDSLLPIVQMSKGISVSTPVIGEAGAANTALTVIVIIATTGSALADKLGAFRIQQTEVACGMTLPVYGA